MDEKATIPDKEPSFRAARLYSYTPRASAELRCRRARVVLGHEHHRAGARFKGFAWGENVAMP